MEPLDDEKANEIEVKDRFKKVFATQINYNKLLDCWISNYCSLVLVVAYKFNGFKICDAVGELNFTCIFWICVLNPTETIKY